MKKVVIGAMAVLALTACSNEEVIQTNEQNQEISFSAVTGKSLSRAADGYCNNATPNTFKVAASYTDGTTFKQYFLDDEYTKSIENTESGYASHKTYVTNGPVRYWPDLGTDADATSLKFYAYVNANAKWVETTGTDAYKAMKADFTVADNVAEQKDFIYAVQEVKVKPTTGQTAINFRHGLSQIEFMAKNQNKNIRVEITGVSVCNAINGGTFTFPTGNTNQNYQTHDNSTDVTPENQGSWVLGSDKKNYSVSFSAVPLVGKESATAVSLTTEDASKEYNSNTMYLMPQALTAWNPTTYPDPDYTYTDPKGKNENAYFLVNCKIWNVASPNETAPEGGYTASDIRLWPKNDEYKEIAVPFSADWKQGKRYVYTFVFTTDGNGGYNPDPSGSEPEDVLVPIKLTVTVDDFVKGADEKVELKK